MVKKFLFSLIIVGVICLAFTGTTHSTFTDTENSQNILNAGTIDIAAGSDLENLQNPLNTKITQEIQNTETINTTIKNIGTNKAEIHQTTQIQNDNENNINYILNITKYDGTQKINQIQIEKNLTQTNEKIYLETLEPNQHLKITNEFTTKTETTDQNIIEITYTAKQTDTEKTNKFYDNLNTITINLEKTPQQPETPTKQTNENTNNRTNDPTNTNPNDNKTNEKELNNSTKTNENNTIGNTTNGDEFNNTTANKGLDNTTADEENSPVCNSNIHEENKITANKGLDNTTADVENQTDGSVNTGEDFCKLTSDCGPDCVGAKENKGVESEFVECDGLDLA
ncbi:M73 family secreted endopeptidase [Methanonatronarchaeum thermophilum]|uniref:M73 family secreted endopeptidase n=2 Tax=Methanonatronarchaeum thermophilum TaxID=1927129 RepID=A0A1Y3GB75_9EURY|nr:M73 family secreted endopeptidase [Methanonatronarchaeum thermophilum]